MSEDWTRFCTRLLHDLVALPSVNPAERSDYDPAVYGEARVVDYVASFFRSRDDRVALRRMPVLPGRENLIVDVGMDAGKETVLLETHADTVEAEGMAFAPFSPFVQNGRLYGRGSCDAKGQLTAMVAGLEMARSDAREDLPVHVRLALVVDEEHRHRGVDRLVDAGLQAKIAIVGEPTDLRLCTALKGSIRFKVITRGIAAHTSVPHRGTNAVYLMAKVLRIFEERIVPAVETVQHPLCGRSTVCVSTIRGGRQINIVPDHCEIGVDRRLNPAEHWRRAYEAIQRAILHELPTDERERIVCTDPYLIDPALETDPAAESVAAFSHVLERRQLQGEAVGLPFGCDASKIAPLGIPTIVFGPGSIDDAHARNESIAIDDVVRAAEVYRDLILHGGEPSRSRRGKEPDGDAGRAV